MGTGKPHSRNGAYKHLGDVAFVQNHATMTEPATWFPDRGSAVKIDLHVIQKMRADADRRLAAGRQSAVDKATAIIRKSIFEQHAYLDGKGFPEMRGLVYHADDNNLLVIPMRVGKQIVGCQQIDRHGVKKFLYGQRCSGAEYALDGHGIDVWCEGYATGLSIHAVMAAMNIRCHVHICFSAGNMQAMATAAGRGIVIADNDESGTGERAVKVTRLPYYMPSSGDFNDYHKLVGTFTAGMEIRSFMQREANHG
ncbi:MAG TPA: hypothetical protein DCQ77_03660 [Betaproteobacteria bacterium]|nr:hypothetical protein [Betaproteobacteria bacterium]